MADGLQFIGEWHSHHRFVLGSPIHGDKDTVDGVFARHDFGYFLLCIVNLRSERPYPLQFWRQQTSAVANAFLFARDMPLPVRRKWVVLEDESPVGNAVRAGPAGHLGPEPDRISWNVDRTTLDPVNVGESTETRPGASHLLQEPPGQAFCHAIASGCGDRFGPVRLHELANGG